MTIPMFNPDSGKSADVHPDEVENWKRHGWREADAPQVELPSDDIDELRKSAERLGIDVDKRWGPKRLREEIDKASA